MVPSKIDSEVVDEFCFVYAIPTRTFNDSSKILDFFGAPSERKGGLPLRRSEKKKVAFYPFVCFLVKSRDFSKYYKIENFKH